MVRRPPQYTCQVQAGRGAGSALNDAIGHRLELPDWASDCRLLLSTVADAALAGDGGLLLRADEGVILTAD